ncbi:hypothetical protein DTO166G4_8506 [Paecilomyces variotii]|nr:hypothetical protein DTO164E3_2276 [Paecilomyces variotii]KAJ9209893.1 hypothetical protein DTO166G4_8506 [Paecilomyces variotii]KAJ9225828.1 hypothetical protein DTO169C6_1891 [Paecilomyces variotii]KAJ9229110.1 hypothetical protein DTO166G5_8116 [Paecilomyces variotii]KAJ9239760.1 hypothetical protein DTO169E5_4272 [Paecilomyces variotii]
MSSSKMEPLRHTSSQRLPPPSLFQGPPSHNASNISLPSGRLASTHGGSAATTPGGVPSPPLFRTRSSRQRSGPLEGQTLLSPFISRSHSQGEVDRSEAIWQEMQNTLAEVELSAMSGEHVFGEKHAKALDELREKQLRLAQAWARSEADEVVDAAKGTEEPHQQSAKKGGSAPGGTAERPGGESSSHKALEEETENDLLLARERREANDRYFDRVKSGVLDVVAKLEEVADAMRAVERESKDIWSESESVDTSGTSSTTR